MRASEVSFGEGVDYTITHDDVAKVSSLAQGSTYPAICISKSDESAELDVFIPGGVLLVTLNNEAAVPEFTSTATAAPVVPSAADIEAYLGSLSPEERAQYLATGNENA